MPVSLHEIPRFEDKISWVYLEYGTLEKDADGVFFVDKVARTPLPVAALALLMLGPGTKVTHRAAQAAAEMNCLLAWSGEGGTRLYAHSTGGTGHANKLRRQARIWANVGTHMAVVRRMYELRFSEDLPEDISLQQIRGREGLRVRQAYKSLAAEYGVEWSGRRYEPGNWSSADLPNRCLSAANAALYGLVHAAVVSVGYSPALGFVHTGRPLSFVYDIADLFKFQVAVPTAFSVAAQGPDHPERAVRKTCRLLFARENLMARILEVLEQLFDMDLATVVDPTAHSWESAFPITLGPEDAVKEEPP